MINDSHIEDCPVCNKHQLLYKLIYPECLNCHWCPISIPFDEDDFEKPKDIYEAGKKAYYDDIPEDSNPFDKSTREHGYWSSGWNDELDSHMQALDDAARM